MTNILGILIRLVLWLFSYDNIWLEKFRQLLITRDPNYLGLIPIRPVLWLFPYRPLKFQDVNQLVQNIMVKDLICSNTYYKALAAAPLLKVRIPKTGPVDCFQIMWGCWLNKLRW